MKSTPAGASARAALAGVAWLALGPAAVAAQSMTPVHVSAVIVDRNADFVPDRIGDTVSIRGIVTSRPRNTHDDWRFVLVQDSSGGLRIAAPPTEGLIDHLQPGDVIHATGVLQQYRGANELRVLQIERGDRTSVPYAREVRLSEAKSERYEGQRVRVVGQLSSRAAPDGDMLFELRDRTGSMPVHLPQRFVESGIGSRLLRGGDVDLVAIVGQADTDAPFDSGYRLAPAEPEDIRFVERPPYARIVVAIAVTALIVIVLLAVRGRRAAERRAAEVSALYENLKQKDAELRESVERKNLLEEQLRQSQKMEAVGLLAGGVAHDFNNLLTVISNYSAMLLEENVSGAMANDLREINAAADRAARLTQQLLAFSRKQLLKPRTVDVNALCLGLVPMLRSLVGEDVRIATVTHARDSYVLADPGQLEQVIMNLVVNARDAMPGGGTVTIATAIARMDPSDAMHAGFETPSGDYVHLSVSDTGEGIDAESQARIFEPFFTTKGSGRGTGLGLATVYGIVKQSGGFILVRSEVGRGSTFSVYLPRTAAVTTEEVDASRATPPRGSETILVVEDELHVQRLVSKALTRQGYTVVAAESAEEAIGLVTDDRQPIDLVLTDIVMPEMNGVAMAEVLRDHDPALRVIFMSGYTDDEIVRRGLRDTEMIFLQKPFTVDTLSRTIRDVLDG